MLTMKEENKERGRDGSNEEQKSETHSIERPKYKEMREKILSRSDDKCGDDKGKWHLMLETCGDNKDGY